MEIGNDDLMEMWKTCGIQTMCPLLTSLACKFAALHTDAFFRSQRDINRHHCWLHFWKIQINSENFIFLHFWDSLGQIWQNWPYFWAFEEKKRLKFWPKNYFFQAKTGFCNFYINIYEYLKPDFKNLIAGLSESVEKCTKSWKL